MIILIPTAHDKMDVQRLPIVTIAFAVICILVHFITYFVGGPSEERLKAAEKELIISTTEYPEATIPEDVKKRLSPGSLEYLRQMGKYQEILTWDEERLELPSDIFGDEAGGISDREREYSDDDDSAEIDFREQVKQELENCGQIFKIDINFYYKSFCQNQRSDPYLSGLGPDTVADAEMVNTLVLYIS